MSQNSWIKINTCMRVYILRGRMIGMHMYTDLYTHTCKDATFKIEERSTTVLKSY